MGESTVQPPPSPIAIQRLGEVPIEGRRKEGECRTLIQTSLDGFMMIDFSGRILDVNEALCQMLGYTREELLRISIPDIEASESPEETADHIQTIARTGSDRFQTRHRRKDGVVIDAEVSAQYAAELGECLFAFLRDITERKHAEEELRIATIAQKEAQLRAQHSESRYKALIQQAADALFVHDFDGRFVEVNQQACDSLGYSSEELLQMDVANISLGFDLTSGHALWSQLEPGKPRNLTATHRRKDGSTFPVEVRFAALDIDGDKLVMTLVRDITGPKNTEQKLRDSLREKEFLMREIHHRVKNNLQMVSALLELQASYVKDEQIRGFFNDCQQRIQSMAMLHEQLHHNKNITQIDFAAYLHSLVANLCAQFSESCRQVTIQINTQACTLPVDTAIPCGLVLNELVSNVFKHAFPDGRTGEVRIALKSSEDGKVILEVADDGVGLPAGLDLHRSQHLGLRLIALLVEKQLHGKLRIESNHGTRVVCEMGAGK